jgi:hypothetical protein
MRQISRLKSLAAPVTSSVYCHEPTTHPVAAAGASYFAAMWTPRSAAGRFGLSARHALQQWKVHVVNESQIYCEFYFRNISSYSWVRILFVFVYKIQILDIFIFCDKFMGLK